nr:hypothetical protein [Desulfobacterales bacterium]
MLVLLIVALNIYLVVNDFRITPVALVPSCHIGLIYYHGEVFDVIHVGGLPSDKKRGFGTGLVRASYHPF